MRRAVLITLLTALALVAVPAGALGKGQSRPNVVFFLSDDQTLASYDSRTMPETQRLLGGSGTTFGEAIVTTPLCCPSRAALITGQYGHNNGVLRNTYEALHDKENVLPAWLRHAGYTTIHVGKFMNQYPESVGDPSKVAPGWDEWHSIVSPTYFNYDFAVNGTAEKYGEGDADYLGRVIDKTTTKLVKQNAPKPKPFYMQVDHYAPHISVGELSGRCANGAVPDPADMDLFTDEPLPRPPNFDEANVSDKPSFMQKLPSLQPAELDDLQELNGCALASLASVDRNVANVYSAVKKAGELDDTVFIFMSDNGFFQGEHRIPVSKQNPYEEALRVPLVVSAPRGLVGRSPQQVDLPVAGIDVTATILDFAGAEPCSSDRSRDCRTLDGRSLVPLLKGKVEQVARRPGCCRRAGPRQIPRRGRRPRLRLHRRAHGRRDPDRAPGRDRPGARWRLRAARPRVRALRPRRRPVPAAEPALDCHRARAERTRDRACPAAGEARRLQGDQGPRPEAGRRPHLVRVTDRPAAALAILGA